MTHEGVLGSTFDGGFQRVDNQRATPGTNYELAAFERKLRRGETSTATVETPPKTPETDQVMVLAHTTPSARLLLHSTKPGATTS